MVITQLIFVSLFTCSDTNGAVHILLVCCLPQVAENVHFLAAVSIQMYVLRKTLDAKHFSKKNYPANYLKCTSGYSERKVNGHKNSVLTATVSSASKTGFTWQGKKCKNCSN